MAMIRTRFPTDTAGPATHARTALNPGEPLLWATFAKHVRCEQRGIGAVPGKLAKAGLSTLEGIIAAFDDLPDADAAPTPDVISFFRSDQDLAAQYGARLTGSSRTLFMLTPARMHIAALGSHPDDAQPEPAPEPEPVGKKKNRFAAFVGDVIETGKDIAAVVTSDTKPRRRTVSVHPLRPLVDIPRAQIAGFDIESDGLARKVHYLRMELTDRSGFEFFCGVVKEREQYERLLALTNGAPE
nr:hypothetical protein [Kibdelosporangium sp. MJ126-NF4]CEL13958.1 hypothetical protein [Kibdelosporangium sp. MJ126-NF4]CTQ88327.1 hypothetical protein [Kibdelosporangium sp. MJ126-NF4]